MNEKEMVRGRGERRQEGKGKEKKQEKIKGKKRRRGKKVSKVGVGPSFSVCQGH